MVLDGALIANIRKFIRFFKIYWIILVGISKWINRLNLWITKKNLIHLNNFYGLKFSIFCLMSVCILSTPFKINPDNFVFHFFPSSFLNNCYRIQITSIIYDHHHLKPLNKWCVQTKFFYFYLLSLFFLHERDRIMISSSSWWWWLSPFKEKSKKSEFYSNNRQPVHFHWKTASHISHTHINNNNNNNNNQVIN